MKELVVEPKKIGIAACGGGATGSLQLAGLRLLREHNIIPDVGIANSVGSINLGEFWGSDFRTKRLYREWFHYQRSSQIFDPDPYQISKSIALEAFALLLGAASRAFNFGQDENTEAAERLERLTAKILNKTGPPYKIQPLIDIVAKINEEKIINQSQELLVTVVNRQLRKTMFISNHDPEIQAHPMKFLLMIMASCAIPGLFPLIPIYYHGAWHEFYDAGGNLPLPLLQLTKRGCDTIIVLRCHSDEFNQMLPDGNLPQLVANALDATRKMEKTEIKTVQKMPNINLFISQPKIRLPKSYNTVSFKPGDHEKADAHMQEVVAEEFEPLINYFKQHPRNNAPQASSA